jgi:hypothetical protein
MALIDKVINSLGIKKFQEAASILSRPKSNGQDKLVLTEAAKQLLPFCTDVAKVEKRYLIDPSVFTAIHQMSDKLMNNEQFISFITPSQPLWFEWTGDKGQKEGCLLKPLAGQRGYSLHLVIEQGQDFSLVPTVTWGDQHSSNTGNITIDYPKEATEARRQELRNVLEETAKKISFLMLLMNSEASPVTEHPLEKNLDAVNKKRMRKNKSPVQALQTITVDLSKMGVKQSRQAEQSPPDKLGFQQGKRLVVEHEVSAYVAWYRDPKTKEFKPRYVARYVRCEGSPKGSTVGQPKHIRLTRSNPDSGHTHTPTGIPLIPLRQKPPTLG